MKLVSLNIWGGRLYESLKYFFDRNKSIDIFCLQETYSPFIKVGEKRLQFSEIAKILSGHNGYFAPTATYPGGSTSGLSVFLKKEIKITEKDDLFVYKARAHYKSENEAPKDASNHPRLLQYIKFKSENKQFVVINLHGLWNPEGKIDLPERLEQSRKTRMFLDKTNDAKILCGDFNLLPETESLKILETGMKNLVKEYKIPTTRSYFYEKSDKFADYVLVSPEINVKDFKILPDVVSDHLPLMLEFS